MTDLYETHLAHAQAVGRRLAPLVKRFGWEPADCEQQAALKLVRLVRSPRFRSFPTPAQAGYVTVSVRRAVFRAARGSKFLVQPAETQVLEAVEARGPVWVDDLFTWAALPSGRVGQYLHCRFVAGWSVEQIRETHSWTVRECVVVRERAALWLLDQFEGRKYRAR
jgi:hypothetical protein